MIKQKIEKVLKQALEELGFESSDIVVSISSEPEFGDYTTNVALQLAKQKSADSEQSSLDIAKEIVSRVQGAASSKDWLEKVEVAGPGFINFFIKKEVLLNNLITKEAVKKVGKKILVEYASPNAFKPFHIGHLRNITTGESVARLLESQGNEVFRVTYTSDIGLSTAKALWGVMQLKDQYTQVKLAQVREKADFLGQAYVLGSNAYEDDPTAKVEIDKLNQQLYQNDPDILDIFQETKSWSAVYLETIYQLLGSKFDAQVWESEVGEAGKQVVKDNIGKIFEESQGAVVFPGEKYGLHTRVFINSAGNPTYEAKDMGLAFLYQKLFPYDEAIHVVGSEQTAYFQVIIKAVELVEEGFVGKKKHLPYGFVNLTTGKMSSRKGSIVKIEDLIDQVKQEIKNEFGQEGLAISDKVTEQVAIGAIKFYLLKFSTPTDITFDVKQSVSIQGDSGPYVQYTYARAQSVLAKANLGAEQLDVEISDAERDVLRYLEYFDGVVEEAALNFQPNELSNYLLQLGKSFNLFYQSCRIIKSDKESFRLLLTQKVAETLKRGLYLLGIEAPEKM